MRAPYLDDGDVRLYLGDCIEVMAEMAAESVDAVVCDPPYGIGFMGKAWDVVKGDGRSWSATGGYSGTTLPEQVGIAVAAFPITGGWSGWGCGGA